MAMKKDDDKTKKSASSKKPVTMSGKQPYKTGGDNPLGVRKLNASMPKASAPLGPRATPSRPMGRDATGSANFDRTPRTRATVSVGPATLSMGGKTAKSKGGMDMSKGTVQPKKSVNPGAKMNMFSKKPYTNPSTNAEVEANNAFTDKRERRQMRTAVGATALGAGIGLNFMGGGNKMKDAVKYIKDTPKRRAKKAAEKAELAEFEAKNPKAKFTASRSTMRKLKKQIIKKK